VEVRNEQEIGQALAVGAPRACCSTTWTTISWRAAVAQVSGRAELEASGGVTLQNRSERAARRPG